MSVNSIGYPYNDYTGQQIQAGECGIKPEDIPASIMADITDYDGAKNETTYTDKNGGCHWRLEAKDGTGTTIHDLMNNDGILSYMQSIYDKENTPNIICDWFAQGNNEFQKESCDYFDVKNNNYLGTNIDYNADGIFDEVGVFLDSHKDRKLPKQ